MLGAVEQSVWDPKGTQACSLPVKLATLALPGGRFSCNTQNKFMMCPPCSPT